MPYGDYDAGSCCHCGDYMGVQWANGGRYRRYCSDKCWQAASRARRRSEGARQVVVARRNQAALLAHELGCAVEDLATGLRTYMAQAQSLDDAHWRLADLLRAVELRIRTEE